jgi:hypothetical protein
MTNRTPHIPPGQVGKYEKSSFVNEPATPAAAPAAGPAAATKPARKPATKVAKRK